MPLTLHNPPSLPYCWICPAHYFQCRLLPWIGTMSNSTVGTGERALKPRAYRACRVNVMHVVQGSQNSLCACRFFDHFVASSAESMHSWRHRLAQCLAVPFDTAVVRLFCTLQAMLTCVTQHQDCREHEPVYTSDVCSWLHCVVWGELVCCTVTTCKLR